jgi:hypothetical protein
MRMKKKFAAIQRINWQETLTPENNEAFFNHLQRALLLALQERGRLDVMEYRYAEEKLRRQRIQRARKLLEKGEGQ